MGQSEPKFMAKYSDREILEGFIETWLDGDPDDIKAAIHAIIKRFGGTSVANQTGIPRSTLYDMVKDEHSPTLENLCLILDFAKNSLIDVA